jgi:mRNA interferase RelE/StbE
VKTFTYSKSAIKTLRRLPTNVSARNVEKIDSYAADSTVLANNVKKLQGRDGYRLRVGDWRVVFDESDTVLDVLAIGARSGIYERDA